MGDMTADQEKKQPPVEEQRAQAARPGPGREGAAAQVGQT